MGMSIKADETLPLIVLPGLHGDAELMQAFCAEMRRNRPVEAIGYPPDREFGYGDLFALVKERLPDGRCVVLGESFSGPLAVKLAASLRLEIGGLVLVSTFVRRPMHPFLKRLVPMLDHRWLPDSLIDALLLGDAELPDVRARLNLVLAELQVGVVRKRMLEALNVDETSALQSVDCPVLCVAGKRDRLFSRQRMREIMQAAPDGRLVELDEPHMLLESNPREAALAIEEFCSQLR